MRYILSRKGVETEAGWIGRVPSGWKKMQRICGRISESVWILTLVTTNGTAGLFFSWKQDVKVLWIDICCRLLGPHQLTTDEEGREGRPSENLQDLQVFARALHLLFVFAHLWVIESVEPTYWKVFSGWMHSSRYVNHSVFIVCEAGRWTLWPAILCLTLKWVDVTSLLSMILEHRSHFPVFLWYLQWKLPLASSSSPWASPPPPCPPPSSLGAALFRPVFWTVGLRISPKFFSRFELAIRFSLGNRPLAFSLLAKSS